MIIMLLLYQLFLIEQSSLSIAETSNTTVRLFPGLVDTLDDSNDRTYNFILHQILIRHTYFQSKQMLCYHRPDNLLASFTQIISYTGRGT